VLEGAKASPRQRLNHNFHLDAEDNPHRFLNVFVRGSYVPPHRHRDPPKAESFVVLRGQVVVITFDDDGAVTAAHVLGDGDHPTGIDLLPGVWHTITAVSDHAVCFEVKPGPYDPSNDKELAPWAPAEGAPEAADYLATLLAEIDSDPPGGGAGDTIPAPPPGEGSGGGATDPEP